MADDKPKKDPKPHAQVDIKCPCCKKEIEVTVFKNRTTASVKHEYEITGKARSVKERTLFEMGQKAGTSVSTKRTTKKKTDKKKTGAAA